LLLFYPADLSQLAKSATANGLTSSDSIDKKVREIKICPVFDEVKKTTFSGILFSKNKDIIEGNNNVIFLKEKLSLILQHRVLL
jgi:hypothetical protein